MLTAVTTGFATGFSLILAIGAQNAFVLRQGLMRAHLFWICLICAVSDTVLIIFGVITIGSIAATATWAIEALKLASAAFLILYGVLSFARAFRLRAVKVEVPESPSLKITLATCMALTWLNPHVYVETFGLIGAISTSFAEPESKLAYGIGAAAASFVFFFGLGYGASALAPVVSRPRAWAVLDFGIALLMWAIAATLIMRADLT
jgi:L-lysine exporter family protein LysE/ArgO